MNLNYRTLNGRFNLVIFGVLCLLIGITLYAHYTVRLSASRSLLAIEHNRSLREKLDAYRNSLQATEGALHQYSTYLSDTQHNALLERLDLLESTAVGLEAGQTQIASALLQRTCDELRTASGELATIIRRYIDIMQNVESRYPGMPILTSHLEPTNRKFSEAVELALQEGELTRNQPNLVASEHYQIMRLFQETRYAWSMQISWFRIFVANRMGVFGEPEAGMRMNLANRELYISKVRTALAELDQHAAKGVLGLQQEESVHQMHEALEYYETHLEQAVSIYLSDNWRADIALLRNELQPALDRLWEITRTIEQTAADVNRSGIDAAQNTTSLLAYFIWFFTGVISIVLIAAYKFFQKKIRQPILQLADSMSTDKEQVSTVPHAGGNVDEVNRLIDAYTVMRHQVDNRQRRLQSILDNAAEGIITIDEHGNIESFNLAAERIFSCDAGNMLGKSFATLIMPDESGNNLQKLHHEFEARQIDSSGQERELLGRRGDGSSVFLSLKFSEMQITGRLLYTAIVSDISERRAVMDHLRHLAEHDSLTGLHNRQYFNETLEHAFARARRNPQHASACIYIDLDNFKYINDTLGHLEGDRLLVGIAHTLKARTRRSDILARLGGDEFALLLPDTDRQQAATVAQNFRQAIADYAFSVGGRTISTGCSIGVAVYETDIDNKEGLLARADIACHMAKRAGRNRVHVFDQSDKGHIDTLHTEMGWSRRIRQALEHDDFVFSCQPILHIANGSLYSHELQLRMRDAETGSYIMPGGFIDSAERFGLMPELDRWVIEHAFQWLNDNAEENLHYFINLSGKSINDDSLARMIEQLRATLRIKPGQIVFQISEDVAIANLDKTRQFLAALHKLGFKTALVEFGVSYSTFAYLREVDVDYVKINSMFINNMHADELNLALVKAINDICHVLGKATIAEYVQNEQALTMLREVGVDYAQGYNIANAEDYDQATIQFRISEA